MTGPNLKPDTTDYMANLKQKDKHIFDWLEDALQKNEKVIYVTIGSECQWQDWSIKAVKSGVEELYDKDKVRTIWAIPKLGQEGAPAHPFGKDDHRVICSGWLP